MTAAADSRSPFRLALRLAWREAKGGLAGFRVFVICLALGVGAIAAVDSLRAAIRAGLAEQGAAILGGDAEMTFTYRRATPAERAFMADHAESVSEALTFRSMAVARTGEALTEVKAVDDAWPLYGAPDLDPPRPLAEALAERDGLPGAVMDAVLAERLGLAPGAVFRLGRQEFRLAALLQREPDSASSGFMLGPRTLVRSEALADAGLLGPGALYESRYRLALPPGADLAALKRAALEDFRAEGMKWADRRNAAPGMARFVDGIGSFLVLVGLAALAVGGIGIAAAVRDWLDGRTRTIATLRVLGAQSGLILAIHLLRIAPPAALGIALGLALGAGAPLVAAPWIAAALPFPVPLAPQARALAAPAAFGLLAVLAFTLLPLARIERIRVAVLYRDPGRAARPRARWLVAVGGLAGLMVALAVVTSGQKGMALAVAGGLAAALGLLALAAAAIRRAARMLVRHLRGMPALRVALAGIGGPGSEARPVVAALGLGLAVLAAVGQIDANLREAITRDLPARAPAFFFVDIQPGQIGPFRDRMAADPAVSDIGTAPMLRATVTRLDGRPAREVAGDHWVLRGDRGISYADAMPAGTRITEGSWWPADHAGPPLVSMSAREGAELGLRLGDHITLNVLGREITAEIASFREVDFATGGMNFVLILNGAALRGAPQTHIATIHAPPEAEAEILRDVARQWPNITAIRVRETIARVAEALSAIATATAWATGITLVTGFAVLVGAAAAGERARTREAALLKVLGATRARILAAFALRAGLLGAAAGLVALAAGLVAGWAAMRFALDLPFRPAPLPALAVVLGGVMANLLAGLAFALRPLAARPATILRRDG